MLSSITLASSHDDDMYQCDAALWLHTTAYHTTLVDTFAAHTSNKASEHSLQREKLRAVHTLCAYHTVNDAASSSNTRY